MGLPTSWVILSLVHLWWMDRVSRRASRRVEARRCHKFHICGDDALLATTQSGAQHYKSLVQQCGGSASAGKHFESTPKLGILRGVFLERLFEFRVHDGRIESGLSFGALPVRSLVMRGLPREV